MLVFLCLKIKEHAKKPQREDVSYVFLGWLFKLIIKNQLNISKLLQKWGEQAEANVWSRAIWTALFINSGIYSDG